MLKVDFVRLVVFLRWIESAILDIGDEMQKVLVRIGLVSIANVVSFANGMDGTIVARWGALESFLISSGFLKSYRDLDISKVQYLAVVIDSEEATHTTEVLHLLRWLQAIGIKKVCLYDTEGVLKKSKEALTLWLKSEKILKETTSDPLLEQNYMSLEVVSFSDGKHAVAKAANFLLEKHYSISGTEKPTLTESDMTNALGALGYGEPEPDLMLIYGPARCHLGFPPWRIRYAEMV
ncbi:nogo-B receptor-like [Dorcoceras hygrometricum]|uniref:ditrans,polycis-polyprenyl diphosphate synthase [(2E,6E)-farnesyldiphosphate specific] n=1 Tax=Dorcoceras hygrometricum TaxID=472368 RepID=A0A2Z7D0B9_9LAMI|nr:nogo-B receptor-like [Dorcoceras hygrometricum]